MTQVVTEISDSEWSEFLRSRPDSNIFQSPQMLRVYASARGYTPKLFATEGRGGLGSIMAVAVVSFGSMRTSRFTARSICIGGPIGEFSDISKVLESHDAWASECTLFSQIRNLQAVAARETFERVGYKWEDHINYLVDLTDEEKGVLARIAKGKRRGIARAERVGMQLVNLGRSGLDAGYDLLQQTYARARIPLADRSLFVGAYELLPSDLLWAVAGVLDGTPCSVRFVLRWHDTLYDWYAGSSDLGRAMRADEWLVWQILRRGIAAGCKTFDFGGAGPPGEQYGPGQFKREFGGREINPGRFEKAYRPVALRLSKVAFRAWQVLQ